MLVNSRPFGTTKFGEAVTAYELTNERGARAVILDYGATVQSLLVPDAAGGFVDVVLGYDSVAEYENNGGYLGATIGRVGNRIGGGRFSIGGREYALEKNDGENTLHGGARGFDKYVWSAAVTDGALRMSRLSPDGEEGFPGNLSVTVSFVLTDSNEFRISYDADTDAVTPVSLTNHSYFNLAGGGDILGHVLTLNAGRFCEGSPDCLPTGRLLSVEGTPFDFRRGRVLGEALAEDCAQTRLFGGFDHNFVLGGSHAASVYCPESGIVMDMYTTLPGSQLYTANSLSERPGKHGAPMGPHGALCLETQVFPDGMNHYAFPSPLLRPGEHLHTETAYAFSIR